MAMLCGGGSRRVGRVTDRPAGPACRPRSVRVGCALLTTTYDPHHPQYLDEADVRDELTRVYDVCQGCRRCTELCGSFPTLFELIDRHDDRDAGRLTPFEQDSVE